MTSARMIDPAILRLAAVVASSEDAIITETLDGTIETWNRSAERLFGYTAAEVVGHPIEIIVPPEIRAVDDNSSFRVQRGQTARHFQSLGLTKDGRHVPISVSLSTVIDPEGQLIGTSRIVRDISEQKVARAGSDASRGDRQFVGGRDRQQGPERDRADVESAPPNGCSATPRTRLSDGRSG